MAPFVPFPNGAQVELLFVLDGKVIENRLWFWTDGDPPTSVELVGLADGVYDWHTSTILPFLSADLQLATVVATDWSTAGNVGEVTTRPPINGSVVEQSHSANVAVVVPFRWALQFGRLRRNKNFVPGVPLSGIDLNTPTTTTSDFLFEAYAALIDAARVFSPGDYWRWVVTSAIDAGLPRSEMAFSECIGPTPPGAFLVGQRRKRLPLT